MIEPIADELYEKAAELQSYSIEIRSPDTIIRLKENDVKSALKIAREFRELITSKMDLDY
jgi:hypothetical protein